MTRLREVDKAEASHAFVRLVSTTMAYQIPGRYQESEAREVFRAMVEQFGPRTRWWTNMDPARWRPVTRHTFDAVVVGAGNGIIMTVLAFDED
jgi:hypothetical protein